MASIKRLKSKGRALTTTEVWDDRGLVGVPINADYALRKQQFAALPPANIVRPLRAIRRWYELQLSLWQRDIIRKQNGEPAAPVFPHSADITYRNATRFARMGQGQLVQLACRPAC